MKSALVPVHAGVLSALGMLATRPGRQLSNTLMSLLQSVDAKRLVNEFVSLRLKGVEALLAEGLRETQLQAEYSLDLRYQGQSNALNIRWSDKNQCEAEFHAQHEKRYGHRLAIPVELVNVRVRVTGPKRSFSLQSASQGDIEPAQPQSMQGEVPVYERNKLPVLSKIPGPAIVVESIATTWIADGWTAQVDAAGNLLLNRHSR